MPRTTQEIIDRADKLAKQFEDHEPVESNIRDASSLHLVREPFQRRADSEQERADAVLAARKDGQSWAAIGAMLGTSGEAARQRYASPAVKH